MSNPEDPLRHGWGGDKDRRDEVLDRRQADAEEEKNHPHKDGKFGSDLVSDEDLLREMERRG